MDRVLKNLPYFALQATLACGLLIGCQANPHSEKPTGGVEVTVTFDGEPVTEGYVNFVNNQTGLGGGSPLGPDGKATLDSIVVGEYIVTVTPPVPDETDPNPPVVEYPNLPQKFRSEMTSTLKATVETGTKTLTFDLKE